MTENLVNEFTPFAFEMDNGLEPADVFKKLCHLPKCIFLDSAVKHSHLGRFSFVAADPVATLTVCTGDQAAFAKMREFIGNWRLKTIDGLPPFQGGFAGLLSYDLNRSLESIAPTRFDEFQMPAVDLSAYDVVVAFDHEQHQSWLISSGYPEKEEGQQAVRARARAEWFLQVLRSPEKNRARFETQPLLELEGPQFHDRGPQQLCSNFSRDGYLSSVQRVVDYIYAGDVFQVNLAQRLTHPANRSAVDLHLDLRRKNPATFSAFYDLGNAQIVSASPERFLKYCDGRIEARPIKGTRPRTRQPEADLFASSELRASEKDRAENVMIVDLMRNDLSRVCTPDSVRVSQLCKIENYEFVQHLVSSVEGKIATGYEAVDVLEATFPGGSITGAPKVRAMEIIAELEPHARGAYCGSLGYVGFDGSMDWSILIRTITAANGWWQFPVGGGIVAQSDPANEYEETWHKAEGILRALAS